MGESIGDEIADAYQQMLQSTERAPVIGIAILSKKQRDLKSLCRQTPGARVIVQPVTLRELRREIHLAFQRIRKNSAERGTQPADAG